MVPLSPQKKTHNVSCGFFVLWNKQNLFWLVEKNKKAKPQSGLWVFMLAQETPFGIINEVNNPFYIVSQYFRNFFFFFWTVFVWLLHIKS